MTTLGGFVTCVLLLLGAILFTAGFMLRRDYLRQRRMEAMERDWQRRVNMRQPYMRNAIDAEEEAIERANIFLS